MNRYARITDVPTATNPGGIIPFALWDHIQQTVIAFQTERLIAILKARQIGISWIEAAWCLWNAMFKVGDTSLLFSKGETEAIELLGKCYRIYDSLPPWMQFRMDPKSKTELGFPLNKSVIKVFAATEAAGVSFTASRIIADEWEYHPYAEENYINAKPTIDAGGQFIGSFTVDKRKPVTLPKSIFRGASANGFKALFFPYNSRPGRDDVWYESTRASIPTEDLSGLTPDLYMEQNYPRTIEEALSATQTLAAVDLKVLEQMKPRCMAPIQVVSEGIDPKICNIYQDFAVGQVYLAATDTSHGVGKDYNATGIMNARTGAIVADILNNFMEPDELAYWSIKLLAHFRNPVWWIEDNDWGSTTISKAKELNYPNFGYQDDRRTKIGWHTHASNRTTLFGNMIAAFNSAQLTVFNYKGLLQFGDLIRNMDDHGRIEAMKGKNDDYPLMAAILVAKNAEVLRQGTYDPKPIQTLHFEPNRLVRSGR